MALKIVLSLLGWHLLGAAVLAAIDPDEQVYRWAKTAPFGLDMAVPSFWPVTLYLHIRRKWVPQISRHRNH